MKLAFNTWVYSSFPVWVPAYPLEEVIRRLSAIGYKGIEIGAANPHAYPRHIDAEGRKQIRDALKRYGMEVSAMLPAPGGGEGVNPASRNPLERTDAIQYYKDVVDLCAYWGGSTVLYIAGWQVFGTPWKENWTRSVESLIEIAKHASPKGVTLAVEPTSADSNLIETFDDALEMMKESGMSNVKVMFDTFHTIYRNEPASDYVYRMGKNLGYIHVSDTNRLPPGDGSLDFRPFVRAIKEIRYEGWLSFEIGFDKRNVDADSVAERALRYFEKLEKDCSSM